MAQPSVWEIYQCIISTPQYNLERVPLRILHKRGFISFVIVKPNSNQIFLFTFFRFTSSQTVMLVTEKWYH